MRAKKLPPDRSNAHTVEILRTPNGKYVWWPLLEIVDFIPVGKRREISSWGVSPRGNGNAYSRALKVALRWELNRIKEIERRLSESEG